MAYAPPKKQTVSRQSPIKKAVVKTGAVPLTAPPRGTLSVSLSPGPDGNVPFFPQSSGYPFPMPEDDGAPVADTPASAAPAPAPSPAMGIRAAAVNKAPDPEPYDSYPTAPTARVAPSAQLPSADEENSSRDSAMRMGLLIPAIAAMFGGGHAAQLYGNQITARAIAGQQQGQADRQAAAYAAADRARQRIMDQNTAEQTDFLNKFKVVDAGNVLKQKTYSDKIDAFKANEQSTNRRLSTDSKIRDKMLEGLYDMASTPQGILAQQQALEDPNSPERAIFGFTPRYDAQGNYIPLRRPKDVTADKEVDIKGKNADTNAKNAATNSERNQINKELGIKKIASSEKISAAGIASAQKIAADRNKTTLTIAGMNDATRRQIAAQSNAGALDRALISANAANYRAGASLAEKLREFELTYGLKANSAEGKEILGHMASSLKADFYANSIMAQRSLATSDLAKSNPGDAAYNQTVAQIQEYDGLLRDITQKKVEIGARVQFLQRQGQLRRMKQGAVKKPNNNPGMGEVKQADRYDSQPGIGGQ